MTEQPSPTRDDATTPGPAAGGAAFGLVRRWGLLAAVVLLGVVAFALSRGGTECVPPSGAGVCIRPVEDRVAAPVAELPVLGDQDSTLSIEPLRGEVVVLNFWGSWCAPCRTEQPDLNEVAARYADRGVEFLGVDVQEVSETNGLQHESTLEIPYPSLWDPDHSYAAMFAADGPRAMPSTLVLDRDGRVAAAISRATTTRELSALLDAVLAEQ